MTRVNVYLPDDLAVAARDAGLNVSQVTQVALHRELGRRATSAWLAEVRGLPPSKIRHADVIAALDAVRDELGTRNGP